jgi:hypothetical protein
MSPSADRLMDLDDPPEDMQDRADSPGPALQEEA